MRSPTLAVKLDFLFFAALFTAGIIHSNFDWWQFAQPEQGTATSGCMDDAEGRREPFGRLRLATFLGFNSSPSADMEAFRAREDAEVERLWVDGQERGLWRHSISRAMDLAVAKGLPLRSGTNEARRALRCWNCTAAAVQAEPERGRP